MTTFNIHHTIDHSCPGKMLQIGRRYPFLDDFYFIGITERFEESLQLFCRLIGRPVPVESLRKNVNPDKKLRQPYALPPEQRHELEALYEEEYELYRYAQYRLEEQLKNV